MQQSPFQGISAIGSSISAPATGGASSIGSIGSISSPLSPSNVSEADGESFSALLGGALNQVNQSQDVAKTMTTNLMNGKLENLHEMTIAGAKAEIMMKLTTQITGKLSQATTQLFQMQI